MNPRGFLELAKKLAEDENNSAAQRTAVSRAYYAAFNVAAEFLTAIGHDVPADASGHQRAYYFLNNCKDQALIEVAGDLNDLRKLRNRADYDMRDARVEKPTNVRVSVLAADEIIRRLDECKNGPVERSTAVAAAVKDYRNKTGS